MDAITLLKDDHRAVEKLFKQFEQAGDRAFTRKREIVDRIIEELSKHAAVEEQLFYPVTRVTVDGVEDVALESLEEHHIVKWVLSELDSMSPEDERFDAKVTVLIENVRHHVEEEEGEYFPKVRAELGRNALADLGEAMASAKELAPTHPTPRAPDEPPGNLVAGVAAGVAHKVGDTVSGVTQGGVTAFNDLVDRIRGRRRSAPAPTGSSTARKTATKVRSTASDTTDKVTATAKAAKQGGTRTARTAKSGAKATATSARNGASRTRSTAKRAATTTGRTARTAAKRTAAAAR